jgi:hypothetical protein
LARSLHRLNEAACNYDLTERAQNREKRVPGVVKRAGLMLNHCNRCPGGYAAYIDLSDGSYNTFAGQAHGYGIGLRHASFPTRPKTPALRDANHSGRDLAEVAPRSCGIVGLARKSQKSQTSI